MGMFDMVEVYCPGCNELVEEYQTKSGPCRLKMYRTGRSKIPLSLVEELQEREDFFCVNCCENFYFTSILQLFPQMGRRDEDDGY
jgi:hypothetical protein